MRIRYETTVDDFVAFTRFHYDHSPEYRRNRVRFMWLAALGFLVVAVMLAVVLEEAGSVVVLSAVAATAAVAAITLVGLPREIRRQVERQARRLFSEGENKSAVGPHELELIGDELIGKSTYADSRIRVQTVERVVSNGSYTFVYLGSTTALVIPHDAVLEGDPEAFAEALRGRMPPSG